MSDRDLDEITVIRALLSAKPRPVGWPSRRARIEEVGTVWPVASDVALQPADLGGVSEVSGEWSMAPGADTGRALLYFHGGGYCSGSIVSHRRLVTEAGRAAGARTLAIDYRRAPEHPFPAALEDAVGAFEVMLADGLDPARIAVGGDSAGGGLTIALVQHLRAVGRPLPACLWLISPWVDLTLSGETLASKAEADPLISGAYLAELSEAYLGGLDRADPRVSPLFSELGNLPPTLIQVGSDETLLADSTRLAAAMGAASSPVTLEIWPHMIHAFPLWNGGLDAGRRALAQAGRFMRTHWDRA